MADIAITQERYRKIAQALNLAENLELIIYDKTYSGKMEAVKIGEYIVFKVNNVDNNLVKTMEGDKNLSLKIFMKEGAPITFPSMLIRKKLPKLLLQFPSSIAKQIERKHARGHVNLKTPIFLIRREFELLPDETMGMGQINNVSEGGCSITTTMDLRTGDKLQFFIEVVPSQQKQIIDTDGDTMSQQTSNITQDGKLSLELTGVIRNRKAREDGIVTVGIQFLNLDKKTEAEIIAYMRRKGL